MFFLTNIQVHYSTNHSNQKKKSQGLIILKWSNIGMASISIPLVGFPRLHTFNHLLNGRTVFLELPASFDKTFNFYI